MVLSRLLRRKRTRRIGEKVIFGIFVLALSAALFAQWYRYYGSRRSLSYYGSDAATLALRSSHVDILKLTPATDKTRSRNLAELEIGGQTFAISKRLDISGAAGLIHARTSLLEDDSFNWDAEPSAPAVWACALQFREVKSTATVAFDRNCQRLILVGKDASIEIGPISKAMRKYLMGAATGHQNTGK